MQKNPDYNAGFPPPKHLVFSKGFVVLFMIFLLVRVFSILFLPSSSLLLASDLTTDNILNAVNEERSLRNLTTLNINNELGEAAQSKADDMVARKYFAHVDPDGHYIWDKIVADGYAPYLQLGENLAINFYDTNSLMSAWMNSPEHRANILQPNFQDQGMGVSFGDVQQQQFYSSIANTFGTLAPVKAKAAPVAIPTVAAKAQSPAKPVATKKIAVVSPAAPAKLPVAKTSASGTETPPAPASPAASSSPAPETLANQVPAPSLSQPLDIRGNEQLTGNAPQNGFTLNATAQQASTATASEGSLPLGIPQNLSASAVIGNKNSTVVTDYQVNRYLILIAGVTLLLLMLSDIKLAIEKKFKSVDKKFNNFALLIISLLVVAFMYWF